jgi:hypothetical protein
MRIIDTDVPIPNPNMKKRIVLAESYVGRRYSSFCEFVWSNGEVNLGWEEMSMKNSDQQLNTLGYDIPKCVEGSVSNGKSIVRVGFKGLLVDTGQCDARHGFKGFV